MSRSARLRAGFASSVGVAFTALWLAGCDPGGAERAAAESWPPGALLFGETRALRVVAEQLTELEGTPISRHAGTLLRDLPDCPQIVAEAPSGRIGDAIRAVRCAASGAVAPILSDARGTHDLVAVVPLADDRIVARVDVTDAGDVDLELGLPAGAAQGLAGLAIPGAEAPGAAALSDDGSLLHARVRPVNGLDLASLVPDDSQGAQMFRLESQLFSGLVLDGVWEVAVYVPADGQPMPRAALALGFAQRTAAVAAMEAFVTELEATWPVARSAFAVGDARGACLLELNLLPLLAPCYVATGHALVVGWNPDSVRKALDGAPPPPERLGQRSAAVIRLDRFKDADRVLSASADGSLSALPARYPWREVVAEGAATDTGFAIRVRFDSSAPEPRT